MNKKNKNIFRGIFLLAFIMLNLIFSGNKVFAVKHVAHEKDPNNVYLIENRQNFLRVVTGSPNDKTQAGNYEPTALGAADWSLCLQKGKAYPNFDPAKPPHFSQLFFDENDLLKYFQNPGNQYIGLYTMQENVSPDDFVDAIKDANKAGHTPDTEDSYTVYITAKNLMYLFAQDPENIANGQRASYYSVIQDELWHFINSQQRSNWSNPITKDKANRVRPIIDKHYGKDDLIPRYIQATIDVYRSAWWGGKKGVQNTATLRMDYLREKVEFEKVNENNVKLGGAEIEITKLESEKVNIYDNHVKDPEENYNKTFTTVADKNHFIDMREGVYKFHEKKAPKGHKTVPDFKFKVTIDGKVELVEPSDEVKKLVKVDGFKLIIKDESEIFEHDVKKVSFTKYGINYKLAKGAELEIYEKDTDKKVAQWTTDGKNNWELTLPAGKRYRFHEKKAPAGCKLIKDFEFTVHKEEGKATELHNVADTSKVYLQGSQVIVIDEEKQKKEIQIEKLSDDSKALAGAEFELYIKGEPVPIDRWTSTTDIRKTKVYPGVVYTIKETKVPEGKKYKKIADFDFSVEDNGNIKLEGSPADVKATGNKLSITNTYPEKFRIGFAKKKSILDPTFLTDARFEIHDEKGNVVEKWWTVNKITHFEIKPGKYTVKEVVNPKGYEEISDFVFELKKDGTFIIENYDKIKTDGTKTGVVLTQATSDANQWEGSIPLVTMVDRQLKEKKITISKINENSEKISGARLEIWRFNGTTTTTTTHIADLDTTDKDQEVTLNFERTYLISETHAPDGYKKIQDFKLQVDDKGEMKLIDNPNKDLVKLEGDKLIIKDPKNEKDIFISKINELNKRVANAKFDIFESTNLTKPLGTLTSKAEGEDANIKVSFGKEYVIKEKEAPEGYNKINDFKIKVGEDGAITFVGNHDRVTIDGNKLKIKDPFKEYPVKLKKVDEEGNALGGVQFKIYSKRENGNYSWDDNWNSDKEYSKGLWPNEYKVEEEQTPEGYESIDAFEFEVKANGTIELKGENKNVSVDKNSATIKIKNNFKKYKVKFKKVDQDNKQLNTARLEIYSQDDTRIEGWNTNIVAEVSLKPGVYKLKETKTPDGYKGISEITFTVKLDGSVELTNNENASLEGNLITVKNKKKDVPPPPPEKPKKTLKLTVHKLLLSKDEFDKWKSPQTYNASQDKAEFDKLIGKNVQEIADVYFVWKNEKDQYIDAEGNVVDSIDKALGQLTKPSGAEFDTSKLPDGTYKIYEVKEKSTYSGLNGEVLTEMKAAPIEIKLPFENEKGVVEHVHVYPKNTSDKPKIDKNFDETVTDQGVDNTLDVINYQREKSKINRTIGDNIPYAVKTIIPLGSEYKKLMWTDNMTEGLSFNKDVVVEGAGITKADYEIVEDERGFSLSLNESGLEKVKNACKNVELEIMLKYSATLNAKASINLDKNQENTITLDYSNTPSKSSKPLENNPIDGKIKVEKSWDKDGNNQVTDADKNVAVTYILEEKTGNGYSEVSSVTLRYDKANPNQSFSYEFTGLDNTKTYRVRERVGGYEPKYISFEQGVLKITNNANKTYLRPSNPKVVTYGKKFVKVNTQDERLLGSVFAIKKDGKYLKAKSVGRRTQDKEILKQAKDKLSEALDAYNNLKPEQIGKEDETKAKNLIASSQEAFNKAFENEGIGFEYTTDLNDADLIKLTSNEKGQFMIKGLGAGNYELEELKAPNGYAKLRNVRFVVDENSFNNGDIKYSDDSKTNDASRVINKKISIPQTGGIGSLIFMLIGLSLMVFAFLKYKRSLNISESNNMNI
ncbi:SpaA isopeptide-forming pilin-related protein [Anaerococcus vaginalis]|uniref:SpaA isopeptide-forming pilin-related protein n=1 Tax=Anaerococcus vaginalis TaxID=33037 RepID=UPI0029071BD7|nr:SpaA isopeptide-forming pilin-related protein [Anaerococcus vaginalis]MDU5341464.1 SpaA isopeptide-forming pilin-related protein [Anaerococcus vaginalis]